MSDGARRQIVCVAERVLDADPALVWALIANPDRVGEWAGVTMLGYMGTELPEAGQSVFVRASRWGKLAKTRRVEIEAWDAGASVRCLVHIDRSPAKVGFEVTIHPEVAHDGIATTIRLVQRMDVPGAAVVVARWWIDMQLKRKLDRIAKVVQG